MVSTFTQVKVEKKEIHLVVAFKIGINGGNRDRNKYKA